MPSWTVTVTVKKKNRNILLTVFKRFFAGDGEGNRIHTRGWLRIDLCWNRGEKNWKRHIEDFHNNKHLFTVLDKEYRGPRCCFLCGSIAKPVQYNCQINIKILKGLFPAKEFRQIEELKVEAAKFFRLNSKRSVLDGKGATICNRRNICQADVWFY